MINSTDSNRIIWIDMLKGIGILLVIAIHTFGGIILKFSLSFTMPMFFLLSALTSRYSLSYSDFLKNLKKTSIRLLIPSSLVFIFRVVLFYHYSIPDTILALIFSRCEAMTLLNHTVYPIGILWFFSALYSSKIIFDLLQLRLKSRFLSISVIVLTLIGVLLGHFKIWLPLNIDIALAMQIFMYIGYLIKHKRIQTFSTVNIYLRAIVSICMYCALFFITCKLTDAYLDIPMGIYPLFPLCFITALLGILAASTVCLLAEKINIISKPLSCIGKHSMIVYCVHSLDTIIANYWWKTSSLTIHYILRCLINIGIALIIVVIIRYVKSLNFRTSRSL